MTTNFAAKLPNDLQLSQWHFKTDWNIAIWMNGNMGFIIPSV